MVHIRRQVLLTSTPLDVVKYGRRRTLRYKRLSPSSLRRRRKRRALLASGSLSRVVQSTKAKAVADDHLGHTLDLRMNPSRLRLPSRISSTVGQVSNSAAAVTLPPRHCPPSPRRKWDIHPLASRRRPRRLASCPPPTLPVDRARLTSMQTNSGPTADPRMSTRIRDGQMAAARAACTRRRRSPTCARDSRRA